MTRLPTGTISHLFTDIEDSTKLCSADAKQWLACGTLRLPQRASEQVGLAAISQGPGAHAWFDTFLLGRETGG